jgi:hypothetical protein
MLALAVWSAPREAVRTSNDFPGEIEALRRGLAGISRQQTLKKGTDETFVMPDIRALGSLAARAQRSMVTRATAFLALILIPSLSSAAIYKCTAQDGSITYTDAPCPADSTTKYVDPAAPLWLNESSQIMNTTRALTDAESQSPEILAILCADDEFKVWLKAQRHGLPERDARTAKFMRFSYLCRRALHLPVVAGPLPPTPPKRVLGQ